MRQRGDNSLQTNLHVETRELNQYLAFAVLEFVYDTMSSAVLTFYGPELNLEMASQSEGSTRARERANVVAPHILTCRMP
jgi:hypothetical protein